MNVANFTLVILIVYLLAIKLVSYFAYKLSSNCPEDYFLANRNVCLFALVATTMASIFSTGTVVSSPSEFFSKGSEYYWIFFFSLVPLFMMPIVIKFWKLGKVLSYITPSEMLGDFYKSKNVQLVGSVIGLLSLLPYAAAQLVAVGKTFEALTSGTITYAMGVSIVCLAIGLYLYFGGSRAVIWTDVVQGVIFASLLLVSGLLVLNWAGGWELVVTNLRVNAPAQANFDIELKYFEYLPICGAFFFLPYVWQRMYMARSAKTIAANVVILSLVFVVLFSITWIIGTSALVFFPEGLVDDDNVLGAIFNLHAPYFGALVLVAAFAAGMSTVDSQLLSAGSILTQDIRGLLTRQRGKVLNKETDYQFARKATLLLLAGIYCWSLFLQDKTVLSLIVLGIGLNVLFVPVVIGMFFWKRATTTGAFWSLSLGLLIFLLNEFTFISEVLPLTLKSSTWAMLVSCPVYIAAGFIADSSTLRDKQNQYRAILEVPQPQLTRVGPKEQIQEIETLAVNY